MEAAIHNIQNATKHSDGAANDWVLANSEMDKLLRFIARHQTAMISSTIPPAGHIPPAFFSTLIELDEAVSSTIKSEKSATKKMNPVKAKALNGMKQTLKKKVKEFEASLQSYKEVSVNTAGYARWARLTLSARTPPPLLPRTTRPTPFTLLPKRQRRSPQLLAVIRSRVVMTSPPLVEVEGRST